MSNTKHTPGPWRFFEVGEGSIRHLCPATQDGLSILTVVEEQGTQFAAVLEEADARLLAAAPELLEALQEAAMLISEGGDDEDWARLGAKYSKTGDEFGATEKDVRQGVAATIRAVIAKATGGAG